jgi:predicted permease
MTNQWQKVISLIVRTYTTWRALVCAGVRVYPGRVQQIINIIGPTFFAIALGYVLWRVTHSRPGMLVDVAMFVATPCLVFGSMYTTEVVAGEALRLWASYLIIGVGTFSIAWVAFGLFGKRRSWRSGLYLPIVFANTLNIPLPIIYLAFGDEGVAKAVLMYIPNALLIYSVGVYMASGHGGLKQGIITVLRTPMIYAAVLGLVLNVTGAALPEVALTAVKLVGQAAVPLMLIILGMTIGEVRFNQMPLTLGASLIRMGGGFALGMLAVWLLGLTGLPRSIVVFEAAMPSAVFVSLLATKYKNEAELVSSIVLTTTLMSIAVIPALLYYLT